MDSFFLARRSCKSGGRLRAWAQCTEGGHAQSTLQSHTPILPADHAAHLYCIFVDNTWARFVSSEVAEVGRPPAGLGAVEGGTLLAVKSTMQRTPLFPWPTMQHTCIASPRLTHGHVVVSADSVSRDAACGPRRSVRREAMRSQLCSLTTPFSQPTMQRTCVASSISTHGRVVVSTEVA